MESYQKFFDDSEQTKRKNKALIRHVSEIIANDVISKSKKIQDTEIKLYTILEEVLDDEYHIEIGQKSIAISPNLIYVAIISLNDKNRVIVFSGDNAINAGYHAGKIAKNLSTYLNGSGGGDKRFGQGGGKFHSRITNLSELENIAINTIIPQS